MENTTHTTTGAGATAARKAYLAYVCGYAAIRDFATDKVLHYLDGYKTYSKHLASAEDIAKRNGWQLV